MRTPCGRIIEAVDDAERSPRADHRTWCLKIRLVHSGEYRLKASDTAGISLDGGPSSDRRIIGPRGPARRVRSARPIAAVSQQAYLGLLADASTCPPDATEARLGAPATFDRLQASTCSSVGCRRRRHGRATTATGRLHADHRAGLADLARWVEEGVAPASTSYDVRGRAGAAACHGGRRRGGVAAGRLGETPTRSATPTASRSACAPTRNDRLWSTRQCLAVSAKRPPRRGSEPGSSTSCDDPDGSISFRGARHGDT